MQSVQHMFTKSFEQSTVLTAVNLKSYSYSYKNQSYDSFLRSSIEKKKKNVIVQEVYYSIDQKSCAAIRGIQDS